MARGDCDVSHPRGLGDRHPRVRVEFLGIEGGSEPLVIGHRDRAILHYPLALAEQAVDTPVDEHPKLRVAIGVARGICRLGERQENDESVENARNYSAPKPKGQPKLRAGLYSCRSLSD